MADTEREFPIGYTDTRRTQGGQTNVSAAPATYTDVPSLKTYLAASTAHGAAFYTTARLNNMTKNDMVYAARLIQDAAGVK